MRASHVFTALFVAAASAPGTRGEVAVLGAAKDNTLYYDPDGTLSNGQGEHLFAGTTMMAFERRGLVAFDVAAAIPAGATIDAVTLTLHMSKTITTGTEVSLHRVLADWGEGASKAFGEEGGGGPAAPGDATWKHTHFDTQLWGTLGGDFFELQSATEIVFGNGFYEWSSTSLVSDVQSWLDSPGTNFGWIVIGDETLVGTAKRFDSRQNADPAVRPALTVHYTPIPEPGVATGVLALAAVIVRRVER